MDILIVEDQRLFADAIRLTLERMGMTVVGVVESAQAARSALERLAPELVLLDIGLPDEDGLDLGREIVEKHPATKVVAMTAIDDPGIVAESIRLGFSGYIPKSLTAPAFARSIESIRDGQLVAPQPLRRPSGERASLRGQGDPVPALTSREREVLTLLAGGATSDEIAFSLSVSRHTVRTHVNSILAKLQVHSRLQAAAVALRLGIVDMPTADG